ncbi:MAG: alkaline shock response membrane anchor protein AmaP [Ruminococcaceae bacterium]|nr:alkaline shock response membrane anchor protein AmaP [Oscillospiraceae bacterium]
MNYLFRILVAVYSFLLAIFFGIIMISPFGDKVILSMGIDFLSGTFYQSDKYDVLLFIVGLMFFALNIAVLVSGVKGRRSAKYICTETDSGVIRISSYSIESIALGLSKRFNGVKDAKAKVRFNGDKVNILIRLTVLPDVNVPDLCKGIQVRVKESVEATMELSVSDVSVNVDSVSSANQE